MTPIGAAAVGPLRRSFDAPPPPPPPVDASAFGLVGNADFDPDDPELKDGSPLTGAALTTWAGIKWLIGTGYSQYKARTYTEQGGSDIEAVALRDNLYMYSRPLATKYAELAVLFRLTGWLRVLDVWAEIARFQATKLAQGYGLTVPVVPGQVKLPRHNYRCWRQGDNSGNAGSPEQGADYHLLDNPRTHEPIVHLLYALRSNQHLESPGPVKLPGTGANSTYEAVADYWETYIRDWVKAWQGPEQNLGYSVAGTSGGSAVSGWSVHMKGQAHRYYKVASKTGDTYQRAGTGSEQLWPILSRHHSHTHVGCSAAHYWLGKAIPEFSAAAAVGLHGITDLFVERNTFYWNDPTSGGYGQLALWPRSLHDTGHGSFTSPLGNYPEPSNYNGYVTMNMVALWLEGVLPDFPEVWAKPIQRAFNRYLYRGLTTSQGLHVDTLQGGALMGSQAPVRSDGKTLTFASSAGESGSPANPRSNSNLVSSGVCLLLPWDTSDDYGETHIWDRMGRSTSFYDGSDPMAQPQVLGPSLGLLMKQMGFGNMHIEA